MVYYVLAVGIMLCGAFFSLIVKEQYKFKICSIFTLISAATALFPALVVLYKGANISGYMEMSSLFGTVNLLMDTLSAVFVIITAVICFLGVLYASGYMKQSMMQGKSIASHCAFLMISIASMLGILVIKNGLLFLAVLEIMLLSSFFLIIFEDEKKEVLNTGIKYFVYMHISIMFLTAAIAFMSTVSGSLDFSDFAKVLTENPHLANIVFLLSFIGFGIQAGFVPFHNWLPDTDSAAPAPVSGIISGVMLKIGIYGILRMLLMMGAPSKIVSYIVLITALVSVLYGVLYAIVQHNIKKLLAYHSVENIGIIGLGIGIGMLGLSYDAPLTAALGFAGAILHVLNHSIYKALLFFAAGNVYLKTSTGNIELIGGLIKKMPYTALMFIIGSAAICGLPPLNGFISEFLIYAGMLLGIPSSEISLFMALVISIAVTAFAGTMTILCASKAAGIMFLGRARSKISENVKNDVSPRMLIPMGILALPVLIMGIFPHYAVRAVLCPVSLLVRMDNVVPTFNSIVQLMQTLSFLFILFLVILAAAFVLRFLINRKCTEHDVWSFGYNMPDCKMQYTASSYVQPFVSILEPLFKKIPHIKKPEGLFPREAYYKLELEDAEEAYIVKPVIKWDERIIAKLERIQNGNIRQYILLALIFLAASVIYLIFRG